MSAPAEAAVTHTFTANALQIQTSAADPVVVTCNAGNTAVNGADLAAPTVPCADVVSLTVTGDTGINNPIDVSGVTTADFTTLTSVLVTGGDEPTGPGDVIIGSPLNDTINGGAGDETISAGAGADTVGGDNGNDIITAGPGDDSDVRGGNANDTLIWNPGDGSDTVNGQGGDDTIRANGDSGNDQFTVAGDGDGYDIDRVAPALGHLEVATSSNSDKIIISTGDGTDMITGGTGIAAAAVTETSLLGGNGVDTIDGTDTADTITGGDGNDPLSGSGGNDTAVWAAGDDDDSFSGGGGTDTAQANGDNNGETFTFAPDGDGVDIDRTAPIPGHIEADTIERVNVSAGDGSDIVTGSTGLAALGVSSTLLGGGDTDTLTGTDGNDTLQGNTGDNDQLTGGDGDDSLVWSAGDGSDVFHGGVGSGDVATVNGAATPDTFSVAPDGVDFDLDHSSGAHVDADTIERATIAGGAGIDGIAAATVPASLGLALTLTGGADNDTITGSDAADALNGGDNSDTVDGRGGDDALTLNPQPTATDDYDGEGGEDTLVVTSESGNGIWSMKAEPNGLDPPVKFRLARQAASPTVTMLAGTTEHLSMDLGSGTDQFTATPPLSQPSLGLQTTAILGDSGNDTIIGTDLPDTISGGTNNDSLTGGAGPDILNGQAGVDTVQARDGVADQVDCGSEVDNPAQTDQLSLDSVVNCETVDALAEPPATPEEPVIVPATPTTTTPASPTVALVTKKCKKKRGSAAAAKKCKKKK